MHEPLAVLGRVAGILLGIEGLLVEGDRVARALDGQIGNNRLHG